MAERSVSAMRAMFEAKGENQSPPSRGRSPAGSERSNGSRNVSNIRSSFVAVEKSGQHGPMLGLRRISDAEQPAEAASPNQRGRNPLSRTSSLTNVQEEDGGLGTILKGSPFEDSRKLGRSIPRSVPDAKQENQKEANAQPAPVQKVAALAQGAMNKFQSTTQKPPEQKPPPISTKAASKEKSTPASAKTPTSATRTGPALKVSSPSTTNAPSTKPAPRKPTQPQEPKLSSRPSRPSLAAGAAKETRAKSPSKPAPKPQKVSRPSLGNADPDFLSRMSRPTQASALKTEKDSKPEDKKARQSVGGAKPDSGFLERMMRPTQASANKHQEEEEAAAAKQAAPAKTGSSANSRVLERLMKPTQSSSSKHEKDLKSEEGKKSARNSTGGRSAEPGFLERMMRPTAASSSKHVPAEEPRTVTPPRSKTQIAAAVTKPKHKLEAAKAKVEEKLGKGTDDGPEIDVAPASVAPEKTQAEVEAVRPVYERVETEKAEGVPHLTPAAAAKIAQDEALAKRAAPVVAKESSRDKALNAATPGKLDDVEIEPEQPIAEKPIAEKPVAQLEEEQAAAAADIKASDSANTPLDTAAVPASETKDARSEPLKNSAPVAATEPAAKSIEKPAGTTDTKAAESTLSKPVEPVAEPVPEATLKSEWASLKSEDTDVAPPTDATSAGAGDAPKPVLNQGAELVQKAKAEAEEKRAQGEGEGETIAEAVANVQ